MRKGVKAFSDSLLDLLVKTDETDRYVKDLWGRQELLYLGPDEQVRGGVGGRGEGRRVVGCVSCTSFAVKMKRGGAGGRGLWRHLLAVEVPSPGSSALVVRSRLAVIWLSPSRSHPRF